MLLMQNYYGCRKPATPYFHWCVLHICIHYKNIQCVNAAHRYTLCAEQRWANLIVNTTPFSRNKILGFLLPSFKVQI